MKILIAIGVLLIACNSFPAAAQDDPDYLPGPWHFRSVACVDTTVRSVTPRLGDSGQTTFTKAQFDETGVIVTFNSRLGADPVDTSALAAITHYQGTTGNTIMEREHRGDRVQVCFLGGPAPTVYCNPDSDSRGRNYRVYDYRQHAQYWGENEEHDCGGA